jgi:hypothetical protein
MNCPKCGKENPEGGRFCGGCGALLAAPIETPAAADVAPGVPPAPPAAAGPAGPKAPIPMSVILIAIAAVLVLGGGFLAYKNFAKKDDARVTMQIGDEKISIGTEDIERAARQAAEEAERLGKEAERLGKEAERLGNEAAGVSDEEPAAGAIHGKIVQLGWKKYVVKSLDTGKTYTINLGRVTSYSSKRKAAVGDVIQASVEMQGGRLVGTRIVFE